MNVFCFQVKGQTCKLRNIDMLVICLKAKKKMKTYYTFFTKDMKQTMCLVSIAMYARGVCL